jgi:hypothetical protein
MLILIIKTIIQLQTEKCTGTDEKQRGTLFSFINMKHYFQCTKMV